MTFLCITPACGASCSGCSAAISREDQIAYARRYAYLRNLRGRELNVAGIPCVALPTTKRNGDFLSGKDADDAIDAAMKEKQ